MRYLNLHTAGYEEALSKLANADAQIEDLKIQLDDALGAEEMLVQLTDRNLMLSEVRFSISPLHFATLNGVSPSGRSARCLVVFRSMR
jgi:hypothetical protein